MTPRPLISVVAIALLGLPAGRPAFGVEPPAGTQTPPSARSPGSPASPDPLSGPAVKPEEAAPSLVDRTFAGDMKRPDMRPEEAALLKLSLAPAEKQRTDRVLAERASMLDTIVRENIDVLLRLQAARASADKAALGSVNKELREVLRPLLAKGRLQDQLKEALEPENAEKFDALVRGYYRALLADGRKKPLRGGDAAMNPADDPNGVDEERERQAMDRMPDADAASASRRERARLMLEVFGQEVRRSYERIAAEGQGRLEEVAEALDLSPEQRARVQALATEFAQKSKLNPTPAQKSELFGKVLRELSPEQRVKAIEFIRGRR